MIKAPELIPMLLAACPSFRPSWLEHQAEKRLASGWGVDLDRFAEHIVWLLEHDETAELDAVIRTLDQIRREGDHYLLRLAASQSFLEMIQHHAKGSAVTLDAFRPFLPPSERLFWERLLQNPKNPPDSLRGDYLGDRDGG